MNSRGVIAGILISILVIAIFLPENTNAGCTCDAWCRGRGYRGGKCGDGHTCICTGMDSSKCTCDAWCRGRGYRGGKCGDGHTCMCDGKRGKRSVEIPVDIMEQEIDNDFVNVNAKY